MPAALALALALLLSGCGRGAGRAAVPAPPPPPPPRYRVADLGDLSAADLNGRGQVVGHVREEAGRAPRPAGDRGVSLFLWGPDGARRGLDFLPGGEPSGLSLGDRGRVATAVPAGRFSRRAALWEAGTGLRDLGALPGGNDTEPYALSPDGRRVVGRADRDMGRGVSVGNRAFLWEEGKGAKLRDLGTFGGLMAEAAGVNDRGQVVGWAMAGRSILDIARRRGVGYSRRREPGGPSRAVLWRGGRVHDLNGLLAADRGGAWRLWEAVRINDRGQILARGTRGGNAVGHSLLLTPTGEPAGARAAR